MRKPAAKIVLDRTGLVQGEQRKQNEDSHF